MFPLPFFLFLCFLDKKEKKYNSYNNILIGLKLKIHREPERLAFKRFSLQCISSSFIAHVQAIARGGYSLNTDYKSSNFPQFC